MNKYDRLTCQGYSGTSVVSISCDIEMILERLSEYEDTGLSPREVRELQTQTTTIKHGQWIPSRKHKWLLREDGTINEFAFNQGFCNGPVCEICGSGVCVHCNPDWKQSKCDDEHFECSECGEISEYGKEKFCPECGTPMDEGEIK